MIVRLVVSIQSSREISQGVENKVELPNALGLKIEFIQFNDDNYNY